MSQAAESAHNHALCELADDFCRHVLAVRRLSSHTAEAYRRDLRILTATFTDKAASAIDTRDIRRLLAAEGARGAKPASAARRLSAWRMFFEHLRTRGIVETNPVAGLRAPKKPARLPRALSPDEMSHFLDAKVSQQAQWSVARDRAMFELLYACGARVSEMTQMDVEDVDLTSGMARITRGKGGRGRTVPFGDAAAQALQAWLPLRDAMTADGNCRALFVNRQGGRLHPRTVQMRTAKRAAELGMGGMVSPHVFRHSCASHFLQSSGDLRSTQELLGHADIASTQIYTRLDFQNLAQSYDRAHPRAGSAVSAGKRAAKRRQKTS